MKFTLALLIIAITVMTFDVQGQDLKNGLSLNTGVGVIARQDLVFSPFIHKDFSPVNVGLEYTEMRSTIKNLVSDMPPLIQCWQTLMNLTYMMKQG